MELRYARLLPPDDAPRSCVTRTFVPAKHTRCPDSRLGALGPPQRQRENAPAFTTNHDKMQENAHAAAPPTMRTYAPKSSNPYEPRRGREK